jgi:fructoselysine-6-P-deglycase FrlB-like protein
MSALSGVVDSPTNSDNDDIAVLSPQATTATVVTNDDDDNEGDDDDDDRSRHLHTSPIGSNDSANRLHYTTATVNNNSSSNPRNAGRKKSNPVS